MNEGNNLDVFSAMQTNKPYSIYKKTILGRVYVEALDPFTDTPIGVMLYGDPRKNDSTCFIKMWTERDDMFFRNRNAVHFKNGVVIPASIKEEVKEVTIEQYTDEQLKEIINSKFLSLQSKLNKITSEAVLFRMLTIAEEIEKSAAIINAIKGRLSEIGVMDIS